MKRQVVDGSISVPLPDEPVARAKAFGELAAAWSQMLSAIDHLLPVGGMDGGGRLTQNVAPLVRYQMPLVYPRTPLDFGQAASNIAPAGSGDPVSTGSKPNGPSHARAHGEDARAAAKARKAKRRGKGKR